MAQTKSIVNGKQHKSTNDKMEDKEVKLAKRNSELQLQVSEANSASLKPQQQSMLGHKYKKKIATTQAEHSKQVTVNNNGTPTPLKTSS